MTMPKMTMAKMTAANPVVAVAAMPAVTVTSCESLAGDGQRAVVNARAAIAAVMIVLIFVMDVSSVGQSEDRSAMIHP